MWTPYFRGSGTWTHRLQCIDYLDKISTQFGPVCSEFSLFISEEALKTIVSQDSLASLFQERYDRKNNIIKGGIDILNKEDNSLKIEEVIRELGAAFDFSISLLVDKQCINTDEIVNVVLQDTKDSESPKGEIEFIRDGFICYKKGDGKKAITSFEDAGVFKLNHQVTFRIGEILLGDSTLNDVRRALEYFIISGEDAEARSKINFAAVSYLHAAYAAYLLTQDSDSFDLCRKSILLNPLLSEGHYLYAKLAALNNHNLSIVSLASAINLDRNYCLKVQADKDFDSVRHEVLYLFNQLCEQAKSDAVPAFERLKKQNTNIKKVEPYIKKIEQNIKEIKLSDLFSNFYSDCSALSNMFNRNTYFDYLDFKIDSDNFFIQNKGKMLLEKIKDIYDQLIFFQKKIKIERRLRLNKIKKYASQAGLAFTILNSIVLFCLLLLKFENISKRWPFLIYSLLFIIAILSLAIALKYYGRKIRKIFSSFKQFLLKRRKLAKYYILYENKNHIFNISSILVILITMALLFGYIIFFTSFSKSLRFLLESLLIISVLSSSVFAWKFFNVRIEDRKLHKEERELVHNAGQPLTLAIRSVIESNLIIENEITEALDKIKSLL